MKRDQILIATMGDRDVFEQGRSLVKFNATWGIVGKFGVIL